MTIISKKGFCPGCMMTQRVLNSKKVKYTVKHINSEKERNHILDLGFKSYPIVEPNDKIDSKTFCGFRPDKLQAYFD